MTCTSIFVPPWEDSPNSSRGAGVNPPPNRGPQVEGCVMTWFGWHLIYIVSREETP